MMFFVKLGFLVENLVILYSKIRLKRAFFQMRFRNLKRLHILVLRHLPHCHNIDTWIFVRNGAGEESPEEMEVIQGEQHFTLKAVAHRI